MRNILVAVDDVDSTTPASPLIQRAMTLGWAFSSKVWLLHVVPRPGMTPFTVPREVLRGEAASELRHEHRAMQKLAHQLRDNGVDATALVCEGPIVKTLLREAERLHADLIVVTCHRHSLLYRALADGAGERLLHESRRPVMFVPEPRRKPSRHHSEDNGGERKAQPGE